MNKVDPGQYLDGRPPGKTRLLLKEVLVGPEEGAHPAVFVGPNTPVTGTLYCKSTVLWMRQLTEVLTLCAH